MVMSREYQRWIPFPEEVSFSASDLTNGKVKVDRDYVLEKVAGIARDSDLSKYIL